MPYATIPFAVYEPDRAVHAQDASRNIVNALPVRDGWGPMPTLLTFTGALSVQPRGAFTAIAASGTLVTVVGSGAALWRLNNDGSWTDVKSASYSLPSEDRWTFTLFGDRIIAAQSGDTMQYYDIGVSSAFADLPNAPEAKYVAVVGDFVVAGNLSTDPAAVQWSGLNNSEEWTAGEGLSDIQTFPDGGAVQGILPMQGGALIFQERAIRQMTFNPASGFAFTFSVLTDKRGTIAPGSIVKIGASDFMFLAEDGWYRGPDNPVGEQRVNDTFFAAMNADLYFEVKAVADPVRANVWIAYPVIGSSAYANLGYNWQLDRWFNSDASVEELIAFATSGVTIDDIDSLYATIDDIDIPYDSRFWAGGRPTFGGFKRTVGFSTTWRMGYFDGPNGKAVFDTSAVQLAAPKRAFVRGAELIGDVSGLNVTINPMTQDRYTGTLALGVSSNLESRTGIAPMRSTGRVHRFRVTVPSGTTWKTVTALRADFVPEGMA